MDVEVLDEGFTEPIAKEFPAPRAVSGGVRGAGVNLQVSGMDTAKLAMYQADVTALVRKLGKTRPMLLGEYGG